MYDRILVPLDGSRFSEEMIPHAAGLAARAPERPQGQRPQRPHEPGAELEQSRQLGRAQHRADDPLPLVAQPQAQEFGVLQVEHERPQRGGGQREAQSQQHGAARARAAAVGAQQHRQRQQGSAHPQAAEACGEEGQAATHARLQAPGERACRQLREAGQGQCEHGEEGEQGLRLVRMQDQA